MVTVDEKLSALRRLMVEHHLDFYFIPARDAHNNEYVPLCWQRRAWLSGFTGSAGDVLIGRDHAWLWTDSRYFLQAEQQLNPNHFQLMKQAQGAPPLHEWFLLNARDKICGVDPRLINMTQAQQWQKALDSVGGKLHSIEQNLIDAIWLDRSPEPQNPLRQYSLQYAGVSSQHKLQELRQALSEHQSQSHILTMLDAIAWLFNIRGTDIEFNPLVISYAVITPESATLFINPEKIEAGDRLYLESQKINIKPYTAFQAELNLMRGRTWVDPATASWWVQQQLNEAELLLTASPVQMMKALKNPVEIGGMHEAHRQDALAMVKFLHWLENNWPTGVTEISAADELEKFRRQSPECLDLSFDTISGFADNGAIVHYRSTPDTDRRIDGSNLYLIDSGGQYWFGTTDITRTIHLGIPSASQKTHYTLVLKGHLALRHACFPAGVSGEHLDVLARNPLWQAGLNYGHGTGHGVGCYLCVHEGPQRISQGYSKIALEPGMVLSNEPGVYFTGEYGIRIENLCVVIEKSDSFYTFEDLTKVPYARNLIDLSLLSNQEIQWINDYHRDIYDLLMDDLNDGQRLWLTQATAPL